MQKKIGLHNAARINAATKFTGFHNAARINAPKKFTGLHNAVGINAAFFLFILQLSRRVLSVAMRFTVGGDAEHYTTVGANAVFLLLLVHVLPFTILLGSMLAFCFFSLHMFGQLLPVTERLLQFAEILRFTAVIVQEGISPFDCGTFGGKQPFYSAVGVHTFSTAGLGIILLFFRRLVLSSPVVTSAILQQSALL